MKCFLLLTLLNPEPGQFAYKPVNIDAVGSMGILAEYDGRKTTGTLLSISGRGPLYVRELWHEIFKKPCIPGSGNTPLDPLKPFPSDASSSVPMMSRALPRMPLAILPLPSRFADRPARPDPSSSD